MTDATLPARRASRRAKFEPTPEQRRMTEAMHACGIPEETIARVLQISPEALHKHLSYELQVGAAKANLRVAQFVFNSIIGSAAQPAFQSERERLSAAMFWLKCRAGWKETLQLDRFVSVFDMTDQEIEQRLMIDGNAGGGTNVIPLPAPRRA